MICGWHVTSDGYDDEHDDDDDGGDYHPVASACQQSLSGHHEYW